MLLTGFPCQPFSIAGVSKKNSLGRPHGFADETQGTLFYDVVRILRHLRPKAFLLENVKSLLSHDRGNTFRVITHALNELGYVIDHKVIDARHWVPQHRERFFIVGFREDCPTDFSLDDVILPEGPHPRLDLRQACVTPHVSQGARHSTIDQRTPRHGGYALSLRHRKRIEEAFGWAKTVGGPAQTMYRGLDRVHASS